VLKAFGTLSLWASSFGIGGTVSTVGGAVLNTVTKAKSAAAAAEAAKLAGGVGGGGLLATLGTGVGAASGAAIAGTVAAGLAIGGAAGYGINQLTSYIREDNKDLSDLIGEWMSSSVDDARAKLLAGDGSRSGGSDHGKTQVQTDIFFHDDRTEVKQTTKVNQLRFSPGPWQTSAVP